MNHKRLRRSEQRQNERRLKDIRNYPPAPLLNEETGAGIEALLSALREAQQAAPESKVQHG